MKPITQHPDWSTKLEALEPEVKADILAAISTRGSRKGYIKQTCPTMDGPGWAAWQAAACTWNPYKISIMGNCFARNKSLALKLKIEQFFETFDIHSFTLDQDRKALDFIW